MSSSAQSQLGEVLFAPHREFCSYCGYPPLRRSRTNGARICSRCHFGMVLRAPAERVPRQGALFLILDEDMLVQGVSRGAEAVLLVDEPEAVNVPLGELLRPGEINGSWRELARLVSLALTAKPALAAVELRTAGHPILWFTGWVSSCGPPPAALLLLNPLMVAGADA